MSSDMGWNAHPPLPPGVAQAMAAQRLQEDRARAAMAGQLGAQVPFTEDPLSPEDHERLAAERAALEEADRRRVAEERARREHLLPEFAPEAEASSTDVVAGLSRLAPNRLVSIDYEFRSFGRNKAVRGWHFELTHDFWAHDGICWYHGLLLTTAGTGITTKGRHSRVNGPQSGWQPDHTEIARAITGQAPVTFKAETAKTVYETIIGWLGRH